MRYQIEVRECNPQPLEPVTDITSNANLGDIRVGQRLDYVEYQLSIVPVRVIHQGIEILPSLIYVC